MKQKNVTKYGHHHEGAGIDRKLHDPVADRLIPLEPLDLAKIRSIDDLVRAMSKTAFTGRQLGEAADVLEAMARDKDCFVVMTIPKKNGRSPNTGAASLPISGGHSRWFPKRLTPGSSWSRSSICSANGCATSPTSTAPLRMRRSN